MELLKSPFLNDPSSLVAQAFAEIYPSAEYEAILVDKITAKDGTEMVGCTTFPDDGSSKWPDISRREQSQRCWRTSWPIS